MSQFSENEFRSEGPAVWLSRFLAKDQPLQAKTAEILCHYVFFELHCIQSLCSKFAEVFNDLNLALLTSA